MVPPRPYCFLNSSWQKKDIGPCCSINPQVSLFLILLPLWPCTFPFTFKIFGANLAWLGGRSYRRELQSVSPENMRYELRSESVSEELMHWRGMRSEESSPSKKGPYGKSNRRDKNWEKLLEALLFGDKTIILEEYILFLTYMQTTSWETLGWRKHKLESRLLYVLVYKTSANHIDMNHLLHNSGKCIRAAQSFGCKFRSLGEVQVTRYMVFGKWYHLFKP